MTAAVGRKVRHYKLYTMKVSYSSSSRQMQLAWSVLRFFITTQTIDDITPDVLFYFTMFQEILC